MPKSPADRFAARSTTTIRTPTKLCCANRPPSRQCRGGARCPYLPHHRREHAALGCRQRLGLGVPLRSHHRRLQPTQRRLSHRGNLRAVPAAVGGAGVRQLCLVPVCRPQSARRQRTPTATSTPLPANTPTSAPDQHCHCELIADSPTRSPALTPTAPSARLVEDRRHQRGQRTLADSQVDSLADGRLRTTVPSTPLKS